ncbi:MCE family protein [Streptomyces sp. NBC_00562]|uniref:MlaD family protein n=1 Tax=Streptomyces sp. NBC_00562 TaxID=2975777 RepID=UPI002E8011FD|nr:MlaD family protein [Streptomyces sp. NBC_00562]WUC23885.1 MCE family protein [Streptomyces sp. NBC_00562]
MRRARATDAMAPLVKFSLFALVTVLATALLAATIVNISFTPEDTYRAVFSDVTSLEEGDDIRVAGVRVGEVQDIAIKDRTLAEVTFTVSRDRPLLSSTGAVIRYRSLVGSRYVALTEGAGDGTRLKPGGVIPLARTKPALDLNALLGGFKPLFAALSPEDVNRLATEIIKTLQGEGGTVNSLLAHTASLTTTIADRDELIGSVIDNLNTVLGTLDKRDARFSGLLKQLQRLISGLSADRKPIGASLAGIDGLTEATSGLLQDARPPLRDDIAGLRDLTATLNANERTVEGVLKRLPNKLNKLTGTASYGSWFNFYLCDFDGRIVLPKTREILTPELHVARARCS